MSSNAKRWIGLTLAIICGMLAAPFIILVPYHLYTSSGTEYLASNVASALFSASLFLFGLHYGLRLRKQAALELDHSIPVAAEESELRFQSILTLGEYRALIAWLVFSNQIFLFLTLLGLLFTIGSVGASEPNAVAQWIGLFLLLFPFGVILSANRTYNKTPCIKEKLEGHLTVEGIELKGTTYNSVMRWSGVIRVKDESKCFLIYTSPQLAIIISKKDLDVKRFRAILRAVPKLIRELKSN